VPGKDWEYSHYLSLRNFRELSRQAHDTPSQQECFDDKIKLFTTIEPLSRSQPLVRAARRTQPLLLRWCSHGILASSQLITGWPIASVGPTAEHADLKKYRYMGFRGDIGDLGLADLRPTCESFGSKQTVHEGFRDHYDNRSNLGCSFHRVSPLPSYSTHTYIGIYM
jgi:hypothetical protein